MLQEGNWCKKQIYIISGGLKFKKHLEAVRGRELGEAVVLLELSGFLRPHSDGSKEVEGGAMVQHSKLGLFYASLSIL